jgi:hypothetical protein
MVMPVEPGTRLRFLSDEWRAAVREMSDEELAGSVVDQPGLVVNATVTDVPFGEPTLHLHSDRGPVIGWQPGHSPDAAFEIHVDYHVAKAMVLDASATADALVQGFATQGPSRSPATPRSIDTGGRLGSATEIPSSSRTASAPSPPDAATALRPKTVSRAAAQRG